MLRTVIYTSGTVTILSTPGSGLGAFTVSVEVKSRVTLVPMVQLFGYLLNWLCTCNANLVDNYKK